MLTKYNEPFRLESNINTSMIVQESVKTVKKTIGDYFIATDTLKLPYSETSESGGITTQYKCSFSYSKDGIHWATVTLPSGAYRIDSITQIGSQLVVRSDNTIYRYNMSDLETTVPQSDVYVELNGEILGFDTPPIIEDGRTLVPMRFLFEKLGETVEWENDTQTATVNAQDGNTISFSIDDTTASVNSQAVQMDVSARLINEKTLVPLRFLSENLGYTVEWNEETNTAIITK
jgi:hypothetical protein